jgi:hypothetical protein
MSSIRFKRIALLCSLFFVLSGLAFGQAGISGTINGVVTDLSGAVVPKATLTVNGTTLVGDITQMTDDQGLYRFPNLPAGVYKLTVVATGFGTQVIEGVTINAGFAAEINLKLTPATAQQTVEVSGQAPIVDTENSNVQDTISRTQMNDLPNARDVWSLTGITPGINNATLDVGGSSAGTQPAYTAYGYGTGGTAPPFNFGNQYITIDGVNTTEARNGTGMYSDYGSLSEFTVSTQGNDATVPTPGVYMKSVVKSGGDTFHGETYWDYENPDFQGTNISTEQLEQGAGTGTRTTRYSDLNGDLGGPILRKRLWFFVSGRNQLLGNTVTGFPANNPGAGPNNDTKLQDLTYKLSSQINPSNRISHFFTWGRKLVPYRNAASNYYADAVYNYELLPWAANIVYDGIITPKFFVETLVGSWGYNWITSNYKGPDGQTLPRRVEIQDGNFEGSFPVLHESRRRAQFTQSANYYVDHFLKVDHQFKFGYTYEKEAFGHIEDGPLNQVVELFNSPAGSPDFTKPYEVGLLNGPTHEQDYVKHNGVYITDQVKIKTKLTLNLGVRWDYWNAYEPEEHVDPSGTYSAFYYQGAPLANGFSIPATAPSGVIPARGVLYYPFNVTPRIGVAYDLRGNGKTVIKANWGRFYQNPAGDFGSTYINGLQYVGGIFSAGTNNIGTGFIFDWNNPTNAPFNQSQLGAYVAGAPAQGVTVQPHIKDPVMDDTGIFVERQINSSTSVRAGFVYRFLHNNWQQTNITLTTPLFTQAKQINDPGPSGSGTGKTITVYDIPAGVPIPVSQFQMQTPSGNSAQFSNYEVEVNRRMSGKFSLLGSFYWTNQSYLQNGVPSNPDMAINNAVSDHYWTAHFSGTYQAPWRIVITPILRTQEGAPIPRLLNATGLRVGTQSIIAEPYGAFYSPNLTIFDTRVSKQFVLWREASLGVFADLFNFFNTNANQTENTLTGIKTVTISGTKYSTPLFQSPTVVIPPRILKIGLKLYF